jgi:hypothetical protein
VTRRAEVSLLGWANKPAEERQRILDELMWSFADENGDPVRSISERLNDFRDGVSVGFSQGQVVSPTGHLLTDIINGVDADKYREMMDWCLEIVKDANGPVTKFFAAGVEFGLIHALGTDVTACMSLLLQSENIEDLLYDEVGA